MYQQCQRLLVLVNCSPVHRGVFHATFSACLRIDVDAGIIYENPHDVLTVRFSCDLERLVRIRARMGTGLEQLLRCHRVALEALDDERRPARLCIRSFKRIAIEHPALGDAVLQHQIPYCANLAAIFLRLEGCLLLRRIFSPSLQSSKYARVFHPHHYSLHDTPLPTLHSLKPRSYQLHVCIAQGQDTVNKGVG